MGLKNSAVLREVLRSLFSNNLVLCIGKKVKSNSGQHYDASGIRTGRATDIRHWIGIATVLGLFAILKAREPLSVVNRMQSSMPNLGLTLLSSSWIFNGNPEDHPAVSPQQDFRDIGKTFLKNANHDLTRASGYIERRKGKGGRILPLIECLLYRHSA